MPRRARVKSVPQRLGDLAAINLARAKVYGDDYKHVGKAMAGMFPRGLTIRTPEEFRRMVLFVHMHTKMIRYAQSFARGGHADSLDDLAVYAMMTRETDEEAGG